MIYCANSRLRDMSPLLSISLGVLLLIFREVSLVKLASLKIPKYTIRGQAVRLECHYDLEGEALYSVKWYKDDKEFYSFLPGEDPPAHTFNLPGLTVDLLNSSDTVVVLKTADLEASGVYRCEVSGEAPSFRTVVESSQMVVVDLPDDGPHIDGGKPRYGIGDIISVNCTSTRARPGAKLVWQVNGDLAEEAVVRRYPIIRDEDELETSILGLEFKVRKKHFRNRVLKIKCVATIEDFYWRTNEESLLEDHHDRSAMQHGKSTFSPEASSHSSSGHCSKSFHLTVTGLTTLLLSYFSVFRSGR